MTERERYFQNVNAIYNALAQTELLAQLAEEAAELSQAALKLRRVLDGSNPADVSRRDAEDHLLEEYADLSLCWELLDVKFSNFYCDWTDDELRIVYSKAERWRRRLDGENMDESVDLKDILPELTEETPKFGV